MALLYYWRGENYRRDLDWGAGFNLNQRNPLLHTLDLGDSLWAFTRRSDGAYVMAAELIVRAKTRNPKTFAYGAYRVWGDLSRSRYFDVGGQPSSEPLLRALSPPMRAKVLGRSFQGRAAVRRLTASDHAILRVACHDLALEPRARLLPEDRLEYSLLTGDVRGAELLISDPSAGIDAARRQYLSRSARTRNRRLSQQLRELYDGRCQICQWRAAPAYGRDVAEGHHVQWLSRGGEDTLDNMVLLCPNHHRVAHACDAHLDFSDLHMDFGSGQREPLQLNEHLASLQADP